MAGSQKLQIASVNPLIAFTLKDGSLRLEAWHYTVRRGIIVVVMNLFLYDRSQRVCPVMLTSAMGNAMVRVLRDAALL